MKKKLKPIRLWKVDSLILTDGELIEAASEYGFGGTDPIKAAKVLRRWAFKVRRKR